MRIAWRIAPPAPAMIALAVHAALVGCEDSTPPVANQPPDTYITSSVPRDSSRVPHRVEIHWRGADGDGTPAYFEYILDTYPRAADTVDDFVVEMPLPGDPRWAGGRVTANNLVIVARADTLRVDPRTAPPPLAFDRWHTFWVRAVDNEGAIDETPDGRTFQAFTAAPVLSVQEPTIYGQAAVLPRTLVVHWQGYDPIGAGAGAGEQDPLETRWALLRCDLDGLGQPLGFPDSLYALAESRWSPWATWSSADGQSAVLRDLVPAGPGRQGFVIAVQGRDEAGAVTPRFETTEFANNYAPFVADGEAPAGPGLSIFMHHERTDTLVVLGNGFPPAFDVIVETDSVSFSWNRPSAQRYGAGGTDTRYGWDIVEPEQDLEWTAWGSTRSALPRLVGTGRVFHLQGRDDVGRANPSLHQVTTIEITVRPPAKPRR